MIPAGKSGSGPKPFSFELPKTHSEETELKAMEQNEIIPPLEALDPEIKFVLDWCKECITNLAKSGDEHAQLLEQTILIESEDQAIEAVSQLPLEKKKLLVTSDFMALGPSEKNSIEIDAMRLAVLGKRFTLLRYLMKMAKDFEYCTTDRFGWNIAHFLALHAKGEFPINDIPEITELLNAPNDAGATPLEFVNCLSTPSPVSVAAFGPEHGLINPTDFLRYTNHSYWTKPRYTPGAILRLCFGKPDMDDPAYLLTILGPKISSFIETLDNQPCKLKIRKMQGKEVQKELQGQWECLAAQDLPKGSIVALYTGTIFYSKGKDLVLQGDKAFGLCKDFVVDPEQGGGSMAEFINHGFPNCATLSYRDHGRPVMVIIALEDIKMDTVLFISYGPDFFDKASPLTLNQIARDQYLADTMNLTKIPFIWFTPDGRHYCYGDHGKTLVKTNESSATEEQAIEGWANNVKLEYLACYESSFLERTLDPKVYQWLIEDFKK